MNLLDVENIILLAFESMSFSNFNLTIKLDQIVNTRCSSFASLANIQIDSDSCGGSVGGSVGRQVGGWMGGWVGR